jgi:hypothetical protein
MKIRLLAAAALLAHAPAATAQPERITIRMSPTPNETVNRHMTIAAALERAPDTRIETTTAMDIMAVVGPADSRGDYDARIFTSNISTTTVPDQSVSTQPATPPDTPAVVFHYDNLGRTTSASVESNSIAMDTAIVRAMNEVLASVAPIMLSIGETVVVSRELTLQWPGFTAALAGQARYTLMAIDLTGTERIAHLAVSSTIAMTPEPGPASEGVMDVNIDRGIVLHHHMRTNLQGPSSRAPVATIIVTVDLVR